MLEEMDLVAAKATFPIVNFQTSNEVDVVRWSPLLPIVSKSTWMLHFLVRRSDLRLTP